MKRLGAEQRLAEVETFLGTGFRDAAYGNRGFTGTMHRKIVVVEYPAVAPVGWMGGANITKSSRKKQRRSFRVLWKRCPEVEGLD